MKTTKFTLMFLACSAAITSFAQTPSPQCGATNFDPSRNIFTVMNPAAGAVNQQCFLTIYPRGAVPDQAQRYPASYFVEGRYTIELSGGGGGGAGGASKNKGGGGGGAGAAPLRTVQYLSPGVYKLTIGTGGEGGSANGGQTESGNPTNLTNADTGALIAGFQGADVWKQRIQPAKGKGHGGEASVGGSSGGEGGDSRHRSEQPAESGGTSQTPGYYGVPGQAGDEKANSAQANAGGGGGASVGSGGSGESANRNSVAGSGDLGGGGGGGRGGKKTADAGGEGGHGFVRLTMADPVPQVIAPAPQVVVVESTKVIQKYSISSDTLFGFGKFTLQAAGENKLDELANKLRNISVENITVTGHTDRIGSEETNQQLSLNRAESVKVYLVNAGVQSERISVVGMGKSQPVTRPGSCNGKATPKVIACLQPDRRVEIEVAATKVTQ